MNSSPLGSGGWTYVLKSADSPPTEVRRGSWESQTYSRSNSVFMHSASQMSSDSSPVSPSDFDYGATSQSPIYHRGSYSSGYPLAYEDTTMAYSMQAPSYMIPSTDTSAISNLYGTQANFRGWHSNSQTHKSSNTPLYCDPDTPAPLGYSFASTASSQAPVSAEGGSMLVVSTALSSGLGGDRILPSPVASRNTSNVFSTNVTDTLTTLSNNGSQAQNHRISQLLSAECHRPIQDREGSRMTPKVPTVADDSSPEGKGTTLNPPRDIGFGYMQTVDMADGFQTSDSARTKKDDSLYSSETCTSLAYGFGSPTNGKAPTLTSGHAYTQLIHPQASHNSTMLMRANAELGPVAGTATSALSSKGVRQAF